MRSTILNGAGVAAIGTLLFMGLRNIGLSKKKQIMATSLSPSSSPSSLSRTLTHQVFLSFHGPDARETIVSHICEEFERKGITPYIDTKMERGASIGSELLRAIKGARITIVIFSTNYASSSWCLNELVEVMKCKDESSQKVMIIFHQVKPTDVRKQSGDFGKAFKKTCAWKPEEVKQLWTKALTDAANLQGDEVNSHKWKNEADMIAGIATFVLNTLHLTRSMDFDDFVGLQSHMTSIDSLLCLHLNEVKMIGIWGPSGIGKTTISRVLLNELSPKFQLRAHIGNIKRRHLSRYDEYDAKLQLQKELFSKLLEHTGIEIPHVGVVEERFSDKKVLIILDDVDNIWQLEATVLHPGWFGHGSRIIITTQDKKVLKQHGIKNENIYKVDYPATDDALRIFCMYAFGQAYPHDGFEDLAQEVKNLACNLPLALRVMGSHFKGMSKERWELELPYLKSEGLHKDIQRVLKFSYDALSVKEKDLFIDLACFFNGERIHLLKELLGETGLSVSRGLTVLEEKSLISTHEGKLEVHSLLAQLVREELQGCTVLVDAQKICSALTCNTDFLRPIRGINFNLAEIKHELNIEEMTFKRMLSLQYLKVYGEKNRKPILHLPQGLKFLPDKLILLHWDRFPMKAMPSEFHPEFLVKLVMKNSKLEKLWEGNAPLGRLKEIDLTLSSNLREIPNLLNATSLERLKLNQCSSLMEIPSSIGRATNLEVLNLIFCTSLVELPSSIENLDKLVKLDMFGCSSLETLPTNINLESISRLDLSNTGLKSFPEISTNIQTLNLSKTEIEGVPSSIISWSRLRTFHMKECKNLKVFPDFPDSIEVLELSETGIEEVPPSIRYLSRLTKLKMAKCKKLRFLPSNINLESLSELDFSHCTQLNMFPEISTNFEVLDLENTVIEEVPSSIRFWSRLLKLNMRGCKSLKVFPPPPDSIEDLDLTDTEIHSLGGDYNLQLSRLMYLYLNGCKNLVSLPHFLDHLSFLNANGCESLERIEGSFHNPINLSFLNCLKLNQEARELIQISDSQLMFLPGGELPKHFYLQALGDSLTINLPLHRRLPLFLTFKACLLLLPGTYMCGEYIEDDEYDMDSDDDDVNLFTVRNALSCRIRCIRDGLVVGYGSCKYYLPPLIGLTEHLYFLKSTIFSNFPNGADVCFSELEFEFNIAGEYWKIKTCGVQFLEDSGINNESTYKEYAKFVDIGENFHERNIRRRNKSRVPLHYM